MSDYLTPSERDELASAYLDGEATQDEIILVEADAQLLGLVEELGRVAKRVGSPPPAAPGVRAQHLAAALAAFDQRPVATDQVADVPPSENTNVVSLADRAQAAKDRTNKRERRQGVPKWLSAAAASLAILGGAGLVASQQGGSDSDFSSGDEVSASAEDRDGGNSATDESDTQAAPEAASVMPADESATTTAMDSGSDDAMEESLEMADAAQDFADDSPASDGEVEGSGVFGNGDAGLTRSTQAVFPPDTPIAEMLLTLGSDGAPIEESVCATSAGPLAASGASGALSPPLSYFAVVLGEQEAELLVYGPESATLVELANCDQLAQDQ